ncbi:hypothetical protein SAMN05216308_10219 [Nitrosospira sp. Nsp13]|nr:hypothetical protein SAMN05216308_10219 [Nitrosospira sp. Nsp13]
MTAGGKYGVIELHEAGTKQTESVLISSDVSHVADVSVNNSAALCETPASTPTFQTFQPHQNQQFLQKASALPLKCLMTGPPRLTAES